MYKSKNNRIIGKPRLRKLFVFLHLTKPLSFGKGSFEINKKRFECCKLNEEIRKTIHFHKKTWYYFYSCFGKKIEKKIKDYLRSHSKNKNRKDKFKESLEKYMWCRVTPYLKTKALLLIFPQCQWFQKYSFGPILD